jgi:dihydroorotate dehydrogenase
MKLRGIDVGNVANASGARNFFGQGWWYSKITQHALNVTWEGARFDCKTVVVHARNGNMDVGPDRMAPRKLFPDCIVVKPFDFSALNAVGLTCPGLPYLLKQNVWQQMTKPFTISFMPVGKTVEDRVRETQVFVRILLAEKPNFKTRFTLEFNVSCPNTGHDQRAVLGEAIALLLILKELNVPTTVKLNALTSHETAGVIAEHADGLCMGNTVLWGMFPDLIPWKEIFGSDDSPLKKYGGGGLSGWFLRRIHCDWIAKARRLGIRIPIEGCGGILTVDDAMMYRGAGASGIQIGSIGFLAPWNIPDIINYANDPCTRWFR